MSSNSPNIAPNVPPIITTEPAFINVLLEEPEDENVEALGEGVGAEVGEIFVIVGVLGITPERPLLVRDSLRDPLLTAVYRLFERSSELAPPGTAIVYAIIAVEDRRMRRKSRLLVCSNSVIVMYFPSICKAEAKARTKFLLKKSTATAVVGNVAITMFCNTKILDVRRWLEYKQWVEARETAILTA